MSGVIYPPEFRHARTSSREANPVSRSAVTPAPFARSVDNKPAHQSEGMLLRCHHLETNTADAPGRSAAIASRDGHSSITDRNEVSSLMPSPLRHSVLKSKDNLSADGGISQGHNVLMSKKPSDSEFKHAFLARTAAARDKAGYTQETMAEALGMEQSKYSKYEVRTMLPHALVIQFCSLCEINVAWLYTAAIEIPSAKPKRRRRSRVLSAA
jgi:DNA-binding XRE family transcriptional regulator